MWGQVRQEPPGFIRTKLSDLVAMFGLFAAIVVTIALTVLGSSDLMKQVLEWFGLQDVPGVGMLLRVASLLVSVLISWLLFTWIIARLPRESVSFRSSVAGGVARCGRLRDLQAARLDLPAVGGARPGGCDVRPGAWPDGVRVHHRAADPVRDGMGCDVDGEPRAAPVDPPEPARSRRACRCAKDSDVRGALAAVAVGALVRWVFRG